MSSFGEAMFDRLSENSALKNPKNNGRKVIDNTVGEWIDNRDFGRLHDNMFLNTATGEFLNLFGKDYGIIRNEGESDDDYRERIVFEKLEYLNARNLIEIYGLKLYAQINNYDPSSNQLTSDNPYNDMEGLMCENNEEIKSIIEKKFVMGDSIKWF